MNPTATSAERQQLRDLAIARAHALRRQAIQDFWAGAARALVRATAHRRRPAAPAAEVA